MCNKQVIFSFLILMFCLLTLPASTAFSGFALLLDGIRHPVFQAQSIQVRLGDGHPGAGQLEIVIAEIKVRDYVWKDVQLSCAVFQYKSTVIECEDGYVKIPELVSFPVSLHFYSDTQTIKIKSNLTKNESWTLTLQWKGQSWQGDVTIRNVSLDSIAEWLPDLEQMPKLRSGRVNGTVLFSGSETDLKSAVMDLSIEALSFSDQAGLRAGENIQIAIKAGLDRSKHSNQLYWHSEIFWQQGEVFWQPIYMAAANHHLSMRGVFDGEAMHLLDGSLMFAELGTFQFSGVFDISSKRLRVFELKANKIQLSTLYEQVLQPFLRDTTFAEIEFTGHADWTVRLRDDAVQSIQLDLDDVSIVDARNRFAFYRINARIPWLHEGATIVDLRVQNGHVLKVPLGTVRVPLELNQFNVFLPQLALPVLDGLLKLENFSAGYTEKGWRWKFNGGLSPVSMEALTDALQVQRMHGTLSGYIPEVRYDGTNVSVNGVLQLKVFDGSVVIHNLKLIEPMGLAPHLKADAAMRNLDLELLTGTFSFGKMEGRVDIDVRNLELANWMPVHFDAHLFSSSGNYSRRISQAAIENISALGGEGAVAAIQRSILRFFEEFRYAEIGWRCKLRLNICYMGGIESEPLSRYTLVKGGGVPAITVMGYNRVVGWQELITRLLRITSENEPIIQ
ncbi:MAG: hypothetical protein H6940_05435 [Burkholderiales bacterium]|nr:hypothetical protein [Burkholderiales bacterium]